MIKLEYVLNHVCECVDETKESIMEHCPSDWFMPTGDICSGKHESKDCEACWNAEKPEMNPDYIKLAKVAYDTVYQTMLDGEKTHPANEWQNVDIMEHFRHALDHLAGWELEEKDEPHLGNAITRLVIIKYLEDRYDKTD